MIIFGLHTLGILKIKFFYYEKKFLPFNYLKQKIWPSSYGNVFCCWMDSMCWPYIIFNINLF